MKAVGLVTEYNPFHNGHLYHLQTAKRLTQADVVVVVMSGNFTQRGEPTIVDKWTRTQEALANGADLVVELPLFDAVQPGQRFATGALRLLNDLQVTAVVFGAEHPAWDFERLVAAEASFTAPAFTDYRATYATQFNAALVQQTGVSLVDPNDILAFSYFKARAEHKWSMELYPIQRRGSGYHDQSLQTTLASASAIRQAVQDRTVIDDVVPAQTAQDLANLSVIPNWQALYPLLRNHLIQAPVTELRHIYLMSEGLEYRMKEAASRELTFDGFLHAVKTKRYTFARLLRLCLYTVLEATQTEVLNAHPYHHVLGFTAPGRAYLHALKKTVQYPLITKVDADKKATLMNLDYRAGKLYQLFTPVEQDLKHAPIIKLSSKKH